VVTRTMVILIAMDMGMITATVMTTMFTTMIMITRTTIHPLIVMVIVRMLGTSMTTRTIMYDRYPP
jgi:cytochrome c oxidase subunit IV